MIALSLASGLLVLAAVEPVPYRHTLFVQFDGAALTWIPTPEDDNAARDESFLALFEGSEIPAYDGRDIDRQAVLEAVAAQLAGIGVRVVRQRPPDHLPYTMAVVGGDWMDTAATSPVRGIAPEVDCARENPRHVVFAFVGSDEPTIQQATTISQEAAHAWGLDHVVGDGLIMSYDFAALDPAFADGCVPLCEEACQGPDTVFCEAVHEQFCDVGLQDSRAELLYTFGDDEPDVLAPTVEILSPTDGAVVSPGSDLVVEGVIGDDYGGVGWRFALVQDGAVVVDEPAFDRETTWPLTSLPEGSYVVTIEALDHADHTTIATVEFEVAEPASSTGSAVDESDTGAVDPTTGPDSTLEGSTGDDTGGSGADGSDPTDGCRCSGGGPAPPWWAVLIVAWRRRATSTRTWLRRSSSCQSRSRRQRATPRG